MFSMELSFSSSEEIDIEYVVYIIQKNKEG